MARRRIAHFAARIGYVAALAITALVFPSRAIAQPRDCQDLNNCGLIREYVIPAIDILSAVAGIIIVIMIVYGAIQYIAARDNPQAVAEARGKIINAVLALAMLLGAVAFLQWLVPGGVFSP